ncbi:MAG: S9 family peptidase [Negativicutes bacterium]|nr:S9 family peptidase [Negativicutes bacterium]
MNKPFTINDLISIKGVGAAQVSPDGEKIVYVVSETLEKENGYRSCLWLREGERQRQLTNAQIPAVKDGNPKWSPDGSMIAFTTNREKNNQIWLIPVSGGEARSLTNLFKGTGAYNWSADGSKIYFTAKEETTAESKPREGASFEHVTRLNYKMNGVGFYDGYWNQLWSIEVNSGKLERLTSGAYHCGEPIPSPDGKWLAFVSNRTGDEQNSVSDLWLLSLADGSLTNLTRQKVSLSGASWLKDSSGLVYGGHHKGLINGAVAEIWQVNLQGEHNLLSRGFDFLIGTAAGSDVRFDSGSAGPTVAACGKYVFFTATEGGNAYLYRLVLASGEISRLWGEGMMTVFSFHEAKGVIVANISTPEATADLWLADLKKESRFHQITAVNEKLFAERWVAKAENIHFSHPDGTDLEGWLLKPYGYEEGQQYPLVMEIHGGPNAAYGNAFFHEFQVLAGLGYGVFYGNPRGSVGYGEAFATAIIGDWCGIDADDLLFMAEQVRALPWVNAAKMGVTGGSQGGYFTNWLVGHTDLFAAAVTQRGMSNLLSKYGTADNGWSHDKRGMGGADIWDSEDLLMERSPIRYAPKVSTPLLFLHSDQDYRCPLEQAEQFYVALKRLGKTTEMVIFHGENHELSRSGKPANRLTRLDFMMGWFKRFLSE